MGALMARKDLLKGLMDDNEETPAVPAPRPRYAKGAIGAVSQSIAGLKSRALIEIDPFKIDASDFDDRLDYEDGIKELAASIKEHGQQVPILVRPHPEADDRYQIVFGRRRVIAMRQLETPVKAMLRDLDDTELVIAQGQENTARKELTFIERARFALMMDGAGYSRKVMADALSMDQSLISRMINVAETIPDEILRAIGPAPGIGRPRWVKAADLMAQNDWAIPEILAKLSGDTSDARFAAFMLALTPQGAAKKRASAIPGETSLKSRNGEVLGTVNMTPREVQLAFRRKNSDGFETWLVENIAEIHRRYKDERGE